MISNKKLIDLLDTVYLKEPKYKASSNICKDYEEFFSEEDEWLKENFFREKAKIWDYSKYLLKQDEKFVLDSYDRLLINNIISKSDNYFKSK